MENLRLTPRKNKQSVQALRLWLQLLNITTVIEKNIRRKFRFEFQTTLPRFDVLANLDRADGKVPMGELSKRLLVSKGNMTGVVSTLVEEGLIKREKDHKDKRTHYLSLTDRGKRHFQELADAHQTWIEGYFSGLDDEEKKNLLENLGRLKATLQENKQRGIYS